MFAANRGAAFRPRGALAPAQLLSPDRNFVGTRITPDSLKMMVHRQIDIDEETDRLLTELAEEYHGNIGAAVADLLHVREGLEDFADQSESEHAAALRLQRDQSEQDFREGRTVNWDEAKRRG